MISVPRPDALHVVFTQLKKRANPDLKKKKTLNINILYVEAATATTQSTTRSQRMRTEERKRE